MAPEDIGFMFGFYVARVSMAKGVVVAPNAARLGYMERGEGRGGEGSSGWAHVCWSRHIVG